MRRLAAIPVLACMLCSWTHGTTSAASPKELAVWGTQAFPGLKVAFDKFEAEHPQWRVIASSGAGRVVGRGDVVFGSSGRPGITIGPANRTF